MSGLSELGSVRRFNALSGEWVLVSAHRTKRPWTGHRESTDTAPSHPYDSNCALCPGNKRAVGTSNPNYQGVFVFGNDFPALTDRPDWVAELTDGAELDSNLFVEKPECGICRVVCFSEHHNITLAKMSAPDIRKVVNCWVEQTDELLRQPHIQNVQIFENRGEAMGCSNPHPHGQIWAQMSLPTILERELRTLASAAVRLGAPLLTTYAAEELARDERVVFSNEHFVAVVPYWASWPFENLVIPRRQMSRINEMTDGEMDAFAEAIQAVTVRYDNLFEVDFPYSSGIHQAPDDAAVDTSGFTWHMHFYPPLLRSATVKKFMVGYEMLAEAQRDLSVEQAAERLKELPLTHFSSRLDDAKPAAVEQ